MTFWLFFSTVTAGLLFLGIRAANTNSSGEDAMSDTLEALICFGAAALFAMVALLIHFL